MRRDFLFGTVVISGLILLAGCNQNTSSNQQPAASPPASLAQNNAAQPGQNTADNSTAPAPGELSAATQMYVENVALTDMFEVQSGQIAAMRSQSPDIKQFAQQMVDAHTQHLNQLKQLIAKTAPAYHPPMQLDQTHQALLDDLQAGNDQTFDPRYIAQQIDQHSQTLIAARGYIKAADTPEFRNFAQQTIPTATMQLQAINAIDRAHHGHAVGAQASNVPPKRPRRRTRQAR